MPWAPGEVPRVAGRTGSRVRGVVCRLGAEVPAGGSAEVPPRSAPPPGSVEGARRRAAPRRTRCAVPAWAPAPGAAELGVGAGAALRPRLRRGLADGVTAGRGQGSGGCGCPLRRVPPPSAGGVRERRGLLPAAAAAAGLPTLCPKASVRRFSQTVFSALAKVLSRLTDTSSEQREPLKAARKAAVLLFGPCR